jgi:hypothetical protein
MNGQCLRLPVLDQAEGRANEAQDYAKVHQREAAHAAEAIESDLSQIWNLDVGLARMQ